jgi:tRNA A22 N-methylase
MRLRWLSTIISSASVIKMGASFGPQTCRLVLHSRPYLTYTTRIPRHLSTRRRDAISDEAVTKAEIAFGILARKDRSWKRLRHIVDLTIGSEGDVRTIADVGTDHGLLAMGLALSGRFERVIGVDVSERALKDGAFRLQQDVESHRRRNNILEGLPLEFRLADGLHGLVKGEADAICIAGMGVHSMLNIVSSVRGNSEKGLLDEIGVSQLFLQPTNSRPKSQFLLYKTLFQMGWIATDERIEFLSSRWYISSHFERISAVPVDQHSSFILPGTFLARNTTDSLHDVERQAFQEYVRHHIVWLENDRRVSGSLHDCEEDWLHQFAVYKTHA